MSKKANKKDVIFAVISVKFVKPPKKDAERKKAKIMVTIKSKSGPWSITKPYNDIRKYITEIKKKHGKAITAKFKESEYTKNGKNDDYLKYVQKVFNEVGKNAKASSDKLTTTIVKTDKAHLKDLKPSKKGKDKDKDKGKDKGKDKPKESVKDDEKNADAPVPPTVTDDNNGAGNGIVNVSGNTDDIRKEYESKIEELKRKHLHEISTLKNDLSSKESTINALNDTIKANEDIQLTQVTQIDDLKQKLGHLDSKNDDDNDVENLTDKYFKQTKEQEKRINELTQKLSQLTKENGDLKTELTRIQFNAEELGTKLMEYKNSDLGSLKQELYDTELELDEADKKKNELKTTIDDLTQKLTVLEKGQKNVDSIIKERDDFKLKLEAAQSELESVKSESTNIKKESDKKSEETLNKLKEVEEGSKKDIDTLKKEVQKLTKTIESNKDSRKKTAEEMKELRNEIGILKSENGTLKIENEQLLKGGGRDVDLNIEMNLEETFSLFNMAEFDFNENASRNELKKWGNYVKQMVKEINKEFFKEIEKLQKKNDMYETYLEQNNIPLPEDNIDDNDVNINTLPHPLSSMKYQDLMEYEPTKKQLKEYIDLVFDEWRSDEQEFNKTFKMNQKDNNIYNQLKNANNIDNSLAFEEDKNDPDGDGDDINGNIDTHGTGGSGRDGGGTMSMEKYNKQAEELKIALEVIQQLQSVIPQFQQKLKQLKLKLKKNGIAHDDEDDKIIQGQGRRDSSERITKKKQSINQLDDALEHIANLEDEYKKHEGEWNITKDSLLRNHKLDVEALEIEITKLTNKHNNLEKMLQATDIDEYVDDTRRELDMERQIIADIKQQAIERVREIESKRDDTLRENNKLRIQVERHEINENGKFNKLNCEYEDLKNESEHWRVVASGVSDLREKLSQVEADREGLSESYERVLEEKELMSNQYNSEIEELNDEKNKLEMRLRIAEQDLKNFHDAKDGKKVSSFITQTEYLNLRRENDEISERMRNAVSSKIKLLMNSSLEIERLREEIKLLSKQRAISKRDIEPNRFHSNTGFRRFKRRSKSNMSDGALSVDTIGSALPIMNTPHHNLLNNKDDDDVSTITAAWRYTVGFVSSVGTTITSAFKGSKNDNNNMLNASNINLVNTGNNMGMQHGIMVNNGNNIGMGNGIEMNAVLAHKPRNMSMMSMNMEPVTNMPQNRISIAQQQYQQAMGGSHSRAPSAAAYNQRRQRLISQMSSMNGNNMTNNLNPMHPMQKQMPMDILSGLHSTHNSLVNLPNPMNNSGNIMNNHNGHQSMYSNSMIGSQLQSNIGSMSMNQMGNGIDPGMIQPMQEPHRQVPSVNNKVINSKMNEIFNSFDRASRRIHSGDFNQNNQLNGLKLNNFGDATRDSDDDDLSDNKAHIGNANYTSNLLNNNTYAQLDEEEDDDDDNDNLDYTRSYIHKNFNKNNDMDDDYDDDDDDDHNNNEQYFRDDQDFYPSGDIPTL